MPDFLILLIVFLAAAASLSVFIFRSQLKARQIAAQAGARGWRFTFPHWYHIFGRQFRLAGHTPANTVWELRRIWAQKKLLYRWRAYAVSLPYGAVMILPAAAQGIPQESTANMTAVPSPAAAWPASLQLFVTHHRLSSIFADEQLLASLNLFQPPPRGGSLWRLTWQGQNLIIDFAYEDGWQILDNVVQLGEAVIAAGMRAQMG